MVIYVIYWYGLQNCDVSVVIFKNIEKIQLAARKFPVLKQSRKYLPTQQNNIQQSKVQNDVLQSARARYPRKEYLAVL